MHKMLKIFAEILSYVETWV